MNETSSNTNLSGGGVNEAPLTTGELEQERAMQAEAARKAAHDAAVHAGVESARDDTTAAGVYHDAAHPAVTGTGVGDNRDETGDSVTGATIGGVGGALVGAAAGAILGPAGAAAGAVVGALTGAGASGLAVDAIDRVDDDNKVSGIDDGTAPMPDADDTNNRDTVTPIV